MEQTKVLDALKCCIQHECDVCLLQGMERCHQNLKVDSLITVKRLLNEYRQLCATTKKDYLIQKPEMKFYDGVASCLYHCCEHTCGKCHYYNIPRCDDILIQHAYKAINELQMCINSVKQCENANSNKSTTKQTHSGRTIQIGTLLHLLSPDTYLDIVDCDGVTLCSMFVKDYLALAVGKDEKLRYKVVEVNVIQKGVRGLHVVVNNK